MSRSRLAYLVLLLGAAGAGCGLDVEQPEAVDSVDTELRHGKGHDDGDKGRRGKGHDHEARDHGRDHGHKVRGKHHHGDHFKHHKRHKHHPGIPCPLHPTPPNTLAEAARTKKRLAGAASAYGPLTTDTTYATLLASEFSYVTPENELKWGSLQPVSHKEWDFTQADAVIAAARAANQKIKGHALVWHQQLPSWVNDGLSKRDLEKYLDKHIDKVVKRYRGHVEGWDVVNEAIADDGSLRDTVFLRKLGEGYIADAFKAARKADKDAKLYYNDYGIEGLNAKSDAVYELVKKLLKKKVPIDGVGFQAHFTAEHAPSYEDMVENFRRFTELGLTVNLSELDVRVADVSGTFAEKLALQQQVYHRAVAACVAVPGCTAVTTWGFTDRHSWIDSTFGPDDPLPFDENYARKPAYYGMFDAFVGLAPDAPGVAPNLVYSGSFEAGADGFSGFGIAGVEVVSDDAHTGHRSGRASGRTDTWQGPAFELGGLVQPGWEYEVSAYGSIDGAASDTLAMTAKVSCAGEADQFVRLATTTANDDEWVPLTGTLEVPLCDLTGLTLYLEGPAAGVDILLDDVAVRGIGEPLGPNIVANGDFETDVSGWFPWGSTTITHGTAHAHGGSASAFVTNRDASWQGMATSLLASMTPGATYRASAFVRLDGAASDTAILTAKTTCNGTEAFQRIGSATANDSGWVEIRGDLVVPPCALSELSFYVEGPAPGVGIYLDDVSVQQRLSVPVQDPPQTGSFNLIGNGGFELGTSGWAPFGASLGTSTTTVHGGATAGVSSGRTASWQGPSHFLPTGAGSYAVSLYALQDSAETLDLMLSAKLVCNGAESFTTVNTTSAAPDTWVELAGTLAVPTGCTTVQLYVQQGGGSTFPDIFVDDLVVNAESPFNLLGNGDAELGTSDWSPFGAGLDVTTAVVHGGSQAIVASGRTASWQGPSHFLPTGQGAYAVSLFARQDSGASVELMLSAKLVCNGAETFSTIAAANAASGTWVELAGTLNVPAGCTTVQAYVQQNGGSSFPDLYADDLSAVPN